MIKTKKDYKEYVLEDRKALHLDRASFLTRLFSPIYRFQKALRRDEYCSNCYRHFWQKPFKIIAKFRRRRLGIKLGFSIPINVFGKGLSIAHMGTIVVNAQARIGDYCRIHACVNIGNAAGCVNAAPKIGDRVYIGPGAKIFGPIHIADDIAIGANAVVNKSFEEAGITIAGVPARKISNKGSAGF